MNSVRSTQEKLSRLIHHSGGAEAFRAVLYDFYERMSKDILIAYFFDGKNPHEIADRQLEFLLFAAGISPSYSGKSPHQAHLELPPILSGHFDRRLVLLKETLRDHGISDEDIRSWIEFEAAFRNVIVK